MTGAGSQQGGREVRRAGVVAAEAGRPRACRRPAVRRRPPAPRRAAVPALPTGGRRSGSRRARRLLLLAACAAPLLAGCATTVHPPATSVDAVEVYLLDHGRTSSLVLPAGENGAARWAYGDWRWYALGRTTPAVAVAALFWPTQGALGREVLAGAGDAAAVRVGVAVEIDAVHPLLVERDLVAALAAELEQLFAGRVDSVVVNRDNGLAFVHHPVPYSLRHSSNRVVAAWLRGLGCEVRGLALLSRWRVERVSPSLDRSTTSVGD